MTTNRDLKIVFMGTPDFAVATLKTLLEQNYHIVGVVTAPDKPAGRGQKIHTSAVKQFALQHQLNVLQPTNLKSDEFLTELKALQANLHIVVAFRMLPKAVWNLPKYGTFNLHASLLPNYRGAAPIHWAIINGETETGVTTFFIDDKIDTGAIIFSEKTSIAKDATVGDLHDTLMKLGSELVLKTVQHIEAGNVKTTLQPQSKTFKTAYKLNKDNCKIDWTQPLDTIYNKIRGLNPFPAAWCYLDIGDDAPLAIKIFSVEKSYETHQLKAGELVVSKDQIKVACQNGFIVIKTLQLPGKRKMDIKDLLNGFKFSATAKML